MEKKIRKALKKYNPVPSGLSHAIKWIESEIEILKKISSQYVINYLDSFVTLLDDKEFKCYHVVNTFYEVYALKFFTIILFLFFHLNHGVF